MLTKQKSWSSPTRREKKRNTFLSAEDSLCSGKKNSKMHRKTAPKPLQIHVSMF